MRDSFDREVRYLRISVTDRCNFACEHCSPEGNCSSGHLAEAPLSDLVKIVRSAVGLGVRKVRITGGEPLLREGLVGLVSELAQVPALETITMTTNGSLLAPVARGLAEAGLQSVNITLGSVDREEFRRITGGGGLGATLAGIEAAMRASLDVKLNIVAEADDPLDEDRVLKVEEYARRVGASSQRIRRYDAASPKTYDARFDRPPPCGSCDRIRLLSDGRMLACLHSDVVVDVDADRPEEGIAACIAMKPAQGAMKVMASLREIGG
jgi:cyclic pyranopterin phosphate synthase